MQEQKNKVTSDMVAEVMDESEIIVDTLFDKCTMVACKLPNGFVIVETSVCVDPDEYDEEIGVEACMEKIFDKVWELEGYKLQDELAEDDKYSDCDCDGGCEYCPHLENCIDDEDARYDDEYEDICSMIDELDDILDDIYYRNHIHRSVWF